MKTQFKRGFAAALSAVLTFSSTPMVALASDEASESEQLLVAAESEAVGEEHALETQASVARIGSSSYSSIQDAIDATGETPATVALSDNVSLSAPVHVSAGQNITIDLQGKTFTAVAASSPYAVVNRGTFTLTDSVGGGKIVAARGVDNVGGTFTMVSGSIEGASCALNNRSSLLQGVGTPGTALIQGGTLSCSETDSACVQNLEGGSLTLQGGSFTSAGAGIVTNGPLSVPGSATAVSMSAKGVALQFEGGTSSVAAGSYTSTDGVAVVIPNNGTVRNASQVKLMITGGTYKGATSAVALGSPSSAAPVDTESTLTVTGGTFYGLVVANENARPGNVSLTGGTFYKPAGGKLVTSEVNQLIKLVANNYVLVFDEAANATANTTNAYKVESNRYVTSIKLQAKDGSQTVAWAPTYNGNPSENKTATAQVPDSSVSSYAWASAFSGYSKESMVFANNVDAGQVAVTFSGVKGGKSLTVVKQEGTIKPVAVTNSVVPRLKSVSSTPYCAAGVQPGIADVVESYTYDVSYSVAGSDTSVVPAGSQANVTQATLSFNGNFSGTKTVTQGKTYAVERQDIKDVFVSSEPKVEYTGAAVLPRVVVYDHGVKLEQGTDYTIASPHTGSVVSSASATVTGVTNYKNSKSASFEVAQRDISDLELVFDSSRIWPFGTDEATIARAISFKAAGEKLALKTADYGVTFTYLPKGQVRALVSGTAPNCTGGQYISFVIDNDLSRAKVSFDKDSYTYTGTAVEPTVSVTLDGVTVSPSDYYLTLADNNSAGMGTAMITPRTNKLSGSVSAQFVITGDLSNATVTPVPASYGYMGVPVVPHVEVKLGDSVLPESSYKVSASNNVGITAAGKFTVTPADNTLRGSKSDFFAITQRNIADSATTKVELAGGSKQALDPSGAAPRPAVIFTDVPTNTLLSLSSDVTATYKGVQPDGSYKVDVVGKAPNCTGTVSLSFTISSDFADATVTIPEMEFVGMPVSPSASELSVSIGDTQIPATKYTYLVTKNTEPGEGGVIVTPNANSGYSGVKVESFAIVGNLDKASVTLDREIYVPDAEGKVNPQVSVTLGGYTVPASQYRVEVEVNQQAGAGVVTVVPAEGVPYRGSKAVSFLLGDTPVTPDLPDSPDQPSTPSSPSDPDTPDSPSAPDNPSDMNTRPQAGAIPAKEGDTAAGVVSQSGDTYSVALSDSHGDVANGWVIAGGDVYYARDGRALTGKQTIDGRTFLFGNYDAKLRKGFVKDSTTGSIVYATETPGVPAGTQLGQVWTGGWFEVNGERFFAEANGALQTGWYTEANGKHHYLFLESDPEPTGSTARGRWFYVAADDGWYYADASGLVLSGWFDEPGTGLRYALNDDSTKEGEYGKMRVGWYWSRHDGCWYYLFTGAEGNIVGSMARGGWLLVDGNWYLTSPSGALQTGWQFMNGAWYHLCTLHEGLWGAMETGWIWDGTGWYYCNASGVMQAGWLDDGGYRYYLSRGDYGPTGRMITGWVWDWTGWYYLGVGGRMLRGTWTPDGHYVDASGRFVA